ncbi:hypothetical protein [Deinococcus hohokamensis]|uniref:Uncharacterized protein n=1 Tax=Deinococcus hohokamensis TaxID=309883 RepID=A0ABV9ICX6_9DEIO
MPLLFTAPDSWSGMAFSLLLKWGPLDDQRVQAIFNAVWHSPDLTGVYLECGCEPQEQHRWSASEVDPLTHLTFGVANLPSGRAVPCLVTMQRDEKEAVWLDFSLSIQALSQAFPEVGNAFWDVASTDDSSAAWIRQVEVWLAHLGRSVCAEVPFHFGLIGCESALDGTDGIMSVEEIPDIRNIGYLWPSEDGVRFFPRTGPL